MYIRTTITYRRKAEDSAVRGFIIYRIYVQEVYGDTILTSKLKEIMGINMGRVPSQDSLSLFTDHNIEKRLQRHIPNSNSITFDKS